MSHPVPVRRTRLVKYDTYRSLNRRPVFHVLTVRRRYRRCKPSLLAPATALVAAIDLHPPRVLRREHVRLQRLERLEVAALVPVGVAFAAGGQHLNDNHRVRGCLSIEAIATRALLPHWLRPAFASTQLLPKLGGGGSTSRRRRVRAAGLGLSESLLSRAASCSARIPATRRPEVRFDGETAWPSIDLASDANSEDATFGGSNLVVEQSEKAQPE